MTTTELKTLPEKIYVRETSGGRLDARYLKSRDDLVLYTRTNPTITDDMVERAIEADDDKYEEKYGEMMEQGKFPIGPCDDVIIAALEAAINGGE